MIENELAHAEGAEWIDPDSCTNSTQFIRALLEKVGEDDAKTASKYADCWCVAVNPPDDDQFPVVITANVDPHELLFPQDPDAPLKLTCPKERGGGCFDFCERAAVIVYKDGAAQICMKYTPRVDIPRPRPDTYFLSPTGRLTLPDPAELSPESTQPSMRQPSSP